MKLWTEMKRDTDGEWFANDPDPNQCKGAIARDAVAAHALMQAMRQYESDFPLSAAAPQDVIQWVEKRANEIMAEWGFGSEEDA